MSLSNKRLITRQNRICKIWPALFIVSAIAFFGCNDKKQNNTYVESKETINTPTSATTNKPEALNQVSFANLAKSVFDIETFDGSRKLERGKGFVVAKGTMVAPYSLFKSAKYAIATPFIGGSGFKITHYKAIDRINDLIILVADSVDVEPLKLYLNPKIENIKTSILGKKNNNTQPVYSGKCMGSQIHQGNKLFYISNNIDPTHRGTPVFVSTGSILGLGTYRDVLYERTNFAIPSEQIQELLKSSNTRKSLSSIDTPDSKRNKAIKRIILKTDYGDIAIKLYNETPTYRDNFVKLVEENFYDSLLIHRVIKEFGIQMGAADTRYALPDDPVGWKGPGYTLPSHIVSGLYHKRGAIGSPRKPDNKNEDRRSDGSQFYIVTGRKYQDDELDNFEKEYNIKYTDEQRECYRNIGGAPHLDYAYTVFGEVVSGIEVADKMTHVATGTEYRPIKDIRLKKVIIEF